MQTIYSHFLIFTGLLKPQHFSLTGSERAVSE
jgi:hypothetical protein